MTSFSLAPIWMPATSSGVGSFTTGSTGIGAATGGGRAAAGSMAADSRWRLRRVAARRDSALARRAAIAGSVNSSVVLDPGEPALAAAGAGPGPAGSVSPPPPLAVAAGPAGDGFSPVVTGRTTLTSVLLADLA